MVNKQIKAVFFDLGNTLVDKSSVRAGYTLALAYKEVLESAGHKVSEHDIKKVLDEINHEVQKEHRCDPKRHELGTFFYKIAKKLNIDMTIEEAKKHDKEIQEKIIEHAMVLPNVAEILKFLKSKRYKLAVITNSDKKTTKKILKNNNIDKFFNAIVTAKEGGGEKCSGRAYNYAMDMLNLNPEHVLVVSDRLDEDILGAQMFGIKTAKFNFGIHKDKNYSDEEIKPDYEIHDMIELKKFLKER